MTTITWYDARPLTDAQCEYVDNIARTVDGPGGAFEYGENHNLPEYAVGVSSDFEAAAELIEILDVNAQRLTSADIFRAVLNAQGDIRIAKIARDFDNEALEELISCVEEVL